MLELRASSMDRYFSCPGARHAEELAASLPDDVKERDKDTGADEGRLIHWTIAELLRQAVKSGKHPLDGAPDTLNYAARYCLGIMDTLSGADDVLIESQLSCPSEVAGVRIVGTPDCVVLRGATATVYDWKTGWGATQADANRNVQLMTYAWLMFHTFADVGEVAVVLVRPNAEPEDRITKSVYVRDILLQIDWHMSDVAQAVTAQAPPRKPSAGACKWCRACGTQFCQESVAVMTPDMVSLEAKIAELPAMLNEDILRLADATVVAERVCDAIKRELKSRLKSGRMEAGTWRLVPGGDRRSIPNTHAAWCALKEKLPNDAQQRTMLFLGSCTLGTSGVEKIADAVAKANGGTKKAALADLYDALGALVERKPSEPRLTRKG